MIAKYPNVLNKSILLILPLCKVPLYKYHSYIYNSYMNNSDYDFIKKDRVIAVAIRKDIPIAIQEELSAIPTYINRLEHNIEIGKSIVDAYIYLFQVSPEHEEAYSSIILGNYNKLDDDIKYLLITNLPSINTFSVYRAYLNNILYPSPNDFDMLFGMLKANVDVICENAKHFKILKAEILKCGEIESKIDFSKEWLKVYKEVEDGHL